MVVRRESVLLDADVAAIYGVTTKEVNQAVANNAAKFPAGYILELTAKEMSMRLGKEETDLDDVKFLMGHLKLSRAEDVLELVSRYYPEERIQPKTRFAIEELCQQLKSR